MKKKEMQKENDEKQFKSNFNGFRFFVSEFQTYAPPNVPPVSPPQFPTSGANIPP